MIDLLSKELIGAGVLGLWTLTLLYEKYNYNKEMKQIVKNNTIAMAQNTQILQAVAKKL